MSPDHRARAEHKARTDDTLWLIQELLAAGMRPRWYPPSEQLWLLTGAGWQQLDNLDLNPEFCWPAAEWQYTRNLGETLRGAARGLQGGTLEERKKADILLTLQQTSWRVSGLNPAANPATNPAATPESDRLAAAARLSRRWLSDPEAAWLRRLAQQRLDQQRLDQQRLAQQPSQQGPEDTGAKPS